MAKHEEAIIAVSESSTNDTIVVREAFGEMPGAVPLPVAPPAPQPMPTAPQGDGMAPPEDEERQERTPKGWLDSQDAKDFVPFLVGEMKRIRQPNTCVGRHNEAERALGQYKRLNQFVSKALREDWDGKIPIGDVDRLRQQLEHNIEALERMMEAHHEMKRSRRQVGKRRRRASDESACPKCAAPLWEDGDEMVCLACGETGLRKEAGTPHFEGLQYQISAFERAMVGILINAVVSGGRDMEEMFGKLKEKYDFTPREVLALRQILSDMGYPVFKDRARMGEDEDPTDPIEPREWQTQYYA